MDANDNPRRRKCDNGSIICPMTDGVCPSHEATVVKFNVRMNTIMGGITLLAVLLAYLLTSSRSVGGSLARMEGFLATVSAVATAQADTVALMQIDIRDLRVGQNDLSKRPFMPGPNTFHHNGPGQ